MRTIVIGDIHGAFKALLELIKLIDLQDNDQLIFLGDYVDGWSESFETLEYLITLSRKRNDYNLTAPIYLMGNHDELFLNYLKNASSNEKWLFHGGKSTIKSYASRSTSEIDSHIHFLQSLKPYYIDNANNAYFHAGFHNLKGPEYEYYKNITYWDRSLWEMALCLDPNLNRNNNRYPNRLKLYNEIFIGHTPTSRLDSFQPINAANVWNVDTAAAYKGPLTALCLETKEIWQSTLVYKLYPNEKGRN